MEMNLSSAQFSTLAILTAAHPDSVFEPTEPPYTTIRLPQDIKNTGDSLLNWENDYSDAQIALVSIPSQLSAIGLLLKSHVPIKSFIEMSRRILDLDSPQLAELLGVTWQDVYRWQTSEAAISPFIIFKIELISKWMEILEEQNELHNIPALVRMRMFDGLSLLQILRAGVFSTWDTESILNLFTEESKAMRQNLDSLSIRSNTESNEAWREEPQLEVTFRNPK